MRVLLTCGPTFESLDDVRRLTNFSTGKLGTEFANYLAVQGHSVTALRGFYTTYPKPCQAQTVKQFTTTDSLAELFQRFAPDGWDAVYHAAAVSDFKFGKVFKRGPMGELVEIKSGKFGTRDGPLFAQLVATPKVISMLRPLFPQAKIFGWKFEVDGSREHAIALGEKQIKENRTDYCVVNGPAYPDGYGITAASGLIAHCPSTEDLYRQLEALGAPTPSR